MSPSAIPRDHARSDRRDLLRAQGYLQLPGFLASEIAGITARFEHLVRHSGIIHDPQRRTALEVFIERDHELCQLLEHPRLHELIHELLGPDWNYYASEGNLYSGDTSWHEDSSWVHGCCLKACLYLDAVDATSGALQVRPGTHLRPAVASPPSSVSAGSEVPAVALASVPGDLVIFDTNLQHAAFGGGERRRMISMQFWTHFSTPAQWAECDKHMRNWAKSPARSLHTDALHRWASPQLRPHLRQISERHAEHPQYRMRVPSWGWDGEMPSA